MKISKLTSVILAAMMTATAVPFNEVTIPYSNFTSYAVEAESEESYEQEIVAEGMCGENLKWKIESLEDILIISGYGEMTNWEKPEDTPWFEYSDEFDIVIIRPGVGELSEYSLGSNVKIVYLTSYNCVIPDSETAIPADATILGYSNSTAQAYAEKYNREFDKLNEENEEYPLMEGVCTENLEWTLWDDGSLSFYGYGDIVAENGVYPWDVVADSVKKITINTAVRSIGENAFTKCTNLESVMMYTPDCKIADSADVFPNNVLLEVDEGSTAEEYAVKYNLTHDVYNFFTATGEIGDNLTWVLFAGGSLRIYGEGDMIDLGGVSPWAEYEEIITRVQINEGVTSVDKAAFEGCDSIAEMIVLNPDCKFAESEAAIPEDTVIYGAEGSGALMYAQLFGRSFKTLSSEITAPEEEESPFVAEGKCGENLTWVLDDNGSLVFSGEGDMDNWASAEETPWAEYTSMIRTVSMSEEVTSIGDYAFYGCENLVSGALTSVIGAHAYEGCKRMNGYSYYGDVSPINEIRDCAFKGCYSLWAIPIANPDCIIADSEDVFDNNTAIEGYVGSTAHKYAEKYERNFQDITLIENEGSCGENLYWYMTSDGMLGIGGSGEMDNYSEDITAAPWYSFAEDITSICINDFNTDDDAIALSENCFAMCENAEKIYFYNSNCIIADSAETIPENAVIWGYAGSTAQEYAEKYNREFEAIPTTDASGALNEEFTWELNSEGILYITGFGAMDDYTDGNPWGEYADMINSVYFYGNVTSIGKNAFNYCENLEFVDIDESIEFIDMDAFIGCDNLNYINFHGNKKCVIYDSASTIPAQAELIGHFGSPVHEYADAYERSFYWIDGDINEDNSVDSSDASMVLAEYSNIQTGGEAELSSVETTTADVTNDNVVDAADASSILQYYSKASTGGNPTWD